MELTLFVVFLALSLILVVVGLFRGQEHSEMSLIGFFFLFLLSFVIIGNNLQYQTGTIETIDFTYNGSVLTSEIHNLTYSYSNFDQSTGLFTTHNFGYWLAVLSIVGFVGVILGLRKSRGYK